MAKHTYRFDSAQTDYSTCFLLEGDKVGYLAEAVIPPVGTFVSLEDDIDAVVELVRIDLSNPSAVAMVYVELKRVEAKEMSLPIRVR
jgi:hypothetical protein